MRAFIAFEIAPTLKEAILESQKLFSRELGCARAIRAENLHCTILFFKDLPQTGLQDIVGFLKQLPQKSILMESVAWREFQHWKGLICLTGESTQAHLTNWLRANLPKSIAEKGNWQHLVTWKPHITLMRASAKTFEAFQAQAQRAFPKPFQSFTKSLSFPAISIFKSPPKAENGIYERIFSLPLTVIGVEPLN